ncbi:MAG: DUF3800 domain-containing protein [Gammaproteobacteria bacterium]|nr:DUF3800 domain-containing protein [Gammaproteobacteria bacterium]
MNIYIDESGVFKPEVKAQSISCVAALIVPSVIEPELFAAFELWKKSPSLQNKREKNGEIKGKSLNEREVSSLLHLLSHFDVLVEVVCMDMGMTSDTDIQRYKDRTNDSLSKSGWALKLNAPFNPKIIGSLSSPLFSQSLGLFELFRRVLDIAIPYYVQRFPQELASFNWILDSKDKSLTKYEEIMTSLIKPWLQMLTFEEPIRMQEYEDFSAFNEFIISKEDLLEPFKSIVIESKGAFNINKIFKNLNFAQSYPNTGLEIVDILTNCIQRAINNKLQFEGWRFLSSLIVFRVEQAIKIKGFISEDASKYASHTRQFVNYFTVCGKKMTVPDQLRAKAKKGYISWDYLENLTDKKVKRTSLEYY